jgi:hypothetical protein
MPDPPDQKEWDKAAQEYQQTVLQRAQASASTWSGAMATLLGLFGTVGVVAGPSEISKLSTWAKVVIVILVLAAGATGGAGVVLATRAQQPPEVESPNWNGMAYRIYVVKSAKAARSTLMTAQVLGLIAAGLVFLTGLIALVDGALFG